MDLNLKDKIFIVSGGSEGIGESISRTLVDEGAIPVVVSRSEQVTKDFIAELQQSGIDSHCVLGDLQDLSICKRTIDETVSKYNRIDGIVNNAGVNDNAGLKDGPEAFRASVKLNLFHYFDLVHYALPWLKESKGSIVNISSKVAMTGQGGTSGYAASKGAILALTREWALELLPYSIRVNAILPAEVMTPLYRSWLSNFDDPDAKEAEVKAKIPLENRMTTPKEIAAMVTFLLSSRSSHTTGQLLSVDGGYLHLDRGITS